MNEDPPPGYNADALIPPPIGDGPWRISSIALDLSGTCNLACRYCAEGATQPLRKSMSESILEDSLKFLFQSEISRTNRTIRLGSGEPLLALPLLQRMKGLIEEANIPKSERPEVFITTNGTLTDSSIRDWLVSTNWHLKVSIDGPPYIHNRWRVTNDGEGTFTQVAETARDFADRIPSRFSVTAVLCHGNNPEVVFETLVGLGARRIELVPVAHNDPTILLETEDIQLYEDFLEQYNQSFFTNSHKPGDPPILIRNTNIVRRVMGYDLRRIPCGAGRSFLGIGPDGSIYPCFRFIGIEKYILGHIKTGIENDAQEEFLSGPGRPYDLRSPCKECWAAPLCGGPCFACSEMFGLGQPILSHCAFTLADANAAISLVKQLRMWNPERLLEFLPREMGAYANTNEE